MTRKRWEVLAVTKRSDGKFYMELCDTFYCHTVQITEKDALYLSGHLSKGANIYASDFTNPKDDE